jgi:hypothetical protein
VVDTVLGSEDGYAVAKEIRQRDHKTVIILMASRYAPYDQAKGKDAGADDFMDKPFDTQQAIDKVKRAIVTRESAPSSPSVGTPAPAAVATPKPAAQPPRAPGAVLPITAKPTQGSMGQRSGTLVFGQPVQVASAPVVTGIPAAAPSAPLAPAAPAFANPAHAAPAAAPAPAASPAASVAGATNGHFSARLGELGLTAEQVQAVVALSREVVEKVVWEVVPQLAESMIKEEIARLTKEG